MFLAKAMSDCFDCGPTGNVFPRTFREGGADLRRRVLPTELQKQVFLVCTEQVRGTG